MIKTAATLALLGLANASYKSGEIKTRESFLYGKFVAKIKSPNQFGTCTSFFTYFNGPKWSPEKWNELDFEIVPSVRDHPVSTNIIFGDGMFRRESHTYVDGLNPADDWHVYMIEWTPEYIRWSIDGREVRANSKFDPAVKLIKKRQALMMNFWTPQFPQWREGFNDASMPWAALYDFVEVYTYNKKTRMFDLHWRDDFDYLDLSRWEPSDNFGFTDNTTTFFASQVFVQQGNLVLQMSKASTQANDADFMAYLQ